MSRLTYASIVPVLLLVAGCGGTQAPAPADSSSVPSASPSPTPQPKPAAYDVKTRCSADLDAAGEVIAGPSGSWLQLATTGSGESVAVLLHQTSGKGLCGMVPTARHLASKGVKSVLLEFCGYGSSSCPDGVKGQQVAQVKAAVDHARASGAKRVVLVGASMGGSVALRAAPDVQADAVVNLSGVTTWGSECNMTTDAPKATMPTLLAFSPDDAKDLANAKTALPQIPAAQKALVEAPSGHGYSMLLGGPLMDQPTPVLERTTRWVKGEYA